MFSLFEHTFRLDVKTECRQICGNLLKVAECVILDPETAPSYSEEALPSASPEEALHDEIIGCTDDDADEERDSGVDDADDSEFEEEFVDRLIQKYL